MNESFSNDGVVLEQQQQEIVKDNLTVNCSTINPLKEEEVDVILLEENIQLLEKQLFQLKKLLLSANKKRDFDEKCKLETNSNNKQRKDKNNSLLLLKKITIDLIEIIVTLSFVNIGVVSYWRGTWAILEAYLGFRDKSTDKYVQYIWSGWTCLAIGVIILLVCHVFSSLLCVTSIINKWSEKLGETLDTVISSGFTFNKVLKIVAVTLIFTLERLYTYIAGFATVCCWKGIWSLWDGYLSPVVDVGVTQEISGWITHSIGVFLLLITWNLRSILAPPSLALMDNNLNLRGFVCDKWTGITYLKDKYREYKKYKK
ncbi:hypothetical protein ABK040_001327 [Willaertia magna]